MKKENSMVNIKAEENLIEVDKFGEDMDKHNEKSSIMDEKATWDAKTFQDETTTGDDIVIRDDLFLDNIELQVVYDEEDEQIRESLKQQVNAELEELSIATEPVVIQKIPEGRRGRIFKKILLAAGITVAVLFICSVWLFGTRSGRQVIYRIAGGYIYQNIDKENHVEASSGTLEDNTPEIVKNNETVEAGDPKDEIIQAVPEPRSEEYVSNFLIFGVEEIEHAKNTDTIMLASINRRDNSIKLTSLLRDTYIETVDQKPNKLNAVYAVEGTSGLVKVIEQNYRIKIDGYAYINFNAFEAIIDYLGGIPIELGEEEALYLNTTNYISNKANRNVKPGWNILNGNQALGYCRVRKCVTLGGANDDYGRTLRQRRVLEAIFEQYKSKNILELFTIVDDCLGFVKTDVTRSQVEQILEDIIENGINTMDTLRVPVNGTFETPDELSGIDDPLVIDWKANVKELYQFIFLDSVVEAEKLLGSYHFSSSTIAQE